MGNCNGGSLDPHEKATLKKEQGVNTNIGAGMKDDYEKNKQIHKLLLLGAGESGKSTLFKQMMLLHSKKGFTSERKSYKQIIKAGLINNIQIVANQSALLPQEFDIEDNLEIKDKDSWELIQDAKVEDMDESLANAIANLWKDQGIQNIMKHTAKFQIADSAGYYFDKAKEICSLEYEPTDEDIIRARVRTTGIVEFPFDVQNSSFLLVDVGGQRNERKKWIHCFDSITAVLFVVAMSAYDQVLYEEHTVNRMQESLNLFEEICNSRWFTDASVILFLNKYDLFKEKIKSVDLSVCFPETDIYDGEHRPDLDQCANYIKCQFEDRNNSEKIIYTHYTCATDTKLVDKIFLTTADVIIRSALKSTFML